jgi:hypothetical protein
MNSLYAALPNFFLIGAAKAGTTSLYTYLRQHPEIYFSVLKEPHFFDDDEAYSYGPRWYIDEFFPDAIEFSARGEATPFLHLPNIVCKRIADTYGEKAGKLKFIVVLRNPVERAWSHYLDRRRNCAEPYSFEVALEMEAKRLQEDPRAWFGYVRDGLYAQQIIGWLHYFEKSQFLFLLNEDLKHQPKQAIQTVTDFLGVASIECLDVKQHKNVASKARSRLLMRMLTNPPSIVSRSARALLSTRTRRKIKYALKQKNTKPFDEKPEIDRDIELRLRNYFAEDIRLLEELIERDLSQWYTKNIARLD